MKLIIKSIILGPLLILLTSYSPESIDKKYKCLIQMKNYTGEGAYVVISLINKKNEYVETLYVQGDDPEWYYEISSWWKFYGKKRNNIDGISGETLSGGERKMNVLSIDESKFGKGYKLRFESAVENKEYYESEIEIDLKDSNFEPKYEGTGFIRYIRLLAI